MKTGQFNVQVRAKECRGNVDKMIRKFIKKTKKHRIIDEVRDRRFHKKPSVKKREKRRRAERARYREEQKRLRKLEKTNAKR
jgi:ribosomal protein S21|tara:strand:- start:1352 stop:1597 length:246 start_codon:yes stop_codon:yes gene_type:complete